MEKRRWSLPPELRNLKVLRPMKRGDASGSTTAESGVTEEAPSTSELEFRSSAMSVTDTASSEDPMPPSRRESTSSVPNTPVPSSVSTEGQSPPRWWALPAVRYADHGAVDPLDPEGVLDEASVRQLAYLARGRGESIADTIRAIVDFVVSAGESELLENVTLEDLVRWYLANYVIVADGI